MKSLLLVLVSLIILDTCRKHPADQTVQALPEQILKDVAYGSDPEQKMDLYLPAGRTDSTKMVVLVHGGAWSSGDKSDFDPYISDLKKRLANYAIANINYRLATRTTNHFPVQETDMKAAMDFVVQHSSKYHYGQQYVLLGASSGAHMVLLQAYKYHTLRIRAVIDFFGPADMTALYHSADTGSLKQMAIVLLMGGTPDSNPVLYQQSSPIRFVDPTTPPTIIFHGDQDGIVDLAQSQLLESRLRDAGVSSQLTIYPGLGHEFWPPAAMNDAFDRIGAFIKAHVR